MAVATASIKKKKRPAPEAKKPEESASKRETETQFGTPIETEKIKVTFEGLKVTYHLKTTGETLIKEYKKIHALMIIHGRISRDPHGEYTQQCVAKARIEAMKHIPLD